MRPRTELNPIGIDKREDIYSVTSRRRYDDYREEKIEPTEDEEVEEKLTQQTSYQGESPVSLILCYASSPPSSTSSNIFYILSSIFISIRRSMQYGWYIYCAIGQVCWITWTLNEPFSARLRWRSLVSTLYFYLRSKQMLWRSCGYFPRVLFHSF